MSKFPKLDSGECDGLGCGWSGERCWCHANLKSREAYQTTFDKPWDDKSPECKMWEESWRWSWKQYVELPGDKLEEEQRATRKELFELAKKYNIRCISGFAPEDERGAVKFIKRYVDDINRASLPKELYKLLK